ncbi:hypothetical protein MRX96_059290 [Rhipicephalus microplus]
MRDTIRHLRSASYYAQSNSLAERLVHTIKDGMLKQVMINDLIVKLARILPGYQHTPLLFGKSTSELLPNNQIRSRLDTCVVHLYLTAIRIPVWVPSVVVSLRIRVIDKEALQSEYEATLKEELILTEGQSSDLCYSPAFMIGSVLVLFCLVTFFSGVVNQRITAGQRLKCSSKVCIHFTDLMNRSATARVPPCSDFYAHVCTEWDRDNMESPQELHFQNIMKRLYLSLYKQPIPHNSQTNFEKAAAYYQSCLRVFLDGKSELKQIVHMLREVGVNWPKRSARPDLLVMSAKLKQSLDLDSVLVLTMPDTMSLSIQPPSTSFLHDIKRQRYAIDFADNSLEQFSALWRAFSTEDLNETEVQQLLQTEKRFLNYIILAGTSPTTSARYSLSLAALPLACSEFPRGRWDTLLTEAYHVSIAKVTAINIRNRRAFDVACHLVRESGEPAILYYVEWLAVKTLATNADRSIAQLVWSHAERAPFTAQSTCFRSTMQLFGEVVLLEENRRWHLRRPTLLSEFHFVAKEVRDSLSEVIKSDGSHPSMNVFFKYLVHDNIYNNDREHLIESVYATLPDLSENFISNQMLLLNVSLNRDTIRSLGFSWEALEDMLRHDGGLADIQLTALQQDVRTFLQLSYASYFLLAEDLPAAYNFAAVGMLVARHMLAFRRHTIEMARAYTGFMHAGELQGALDKERSEFSIAIDTAQQAVFRTRRYRTLPWSSKARDFFLLMCFQVCSGRNTDEEHKNITFAFSKSRGFQAAFFCRSVVR